jgi:hypothetical protein
MPGESRSPGAFEDYYDAFGELPDGPDRMQASIALQRNFGLSMDFELAARIAHENGCVRRSLQAEKHRSGLRYGR